MKDEQDLIVQGRKSQTPSKIVRYIFLNGSNSSRFGSQYSFKNEEILKNFKILDFHKKNDFLRYLKSALKIIIYAV